MDLEIIGFSIFTIMVVVGVASYLLGKRKTDAPIRSGLIGFAFSIIPALGIVYLVYLFAKQDIDKTQ